MPYNKAFIYSKELTKNSMRVKQKLFERFKNYSRAKQNKVYIL